MRRFRLIFERILDYLYPPRCAGCDEVMSSKAKDAFCPKCRLKWEKLKKDICPKCGQILKECWCNVPNNEEGYVDSEAHLVIYDPTYNSIVKNLIYLVKGVKERRLYETLAKEMYNELYFRLDYTNLAVTAVPRSPRSKTSIGHDQSLTLAKEFCKLSGLEYLPVLVHVGNKKQKRLSQKERTKNAVHSYKIKNGSAPLVKGKTVILIDDVVTTGSTVVRCAHLLKMRGAERVIVFSIAKTVR